MQDFSFGTLSTDELRLNRWRLRHAGVTHFNRQLPRDPLPGQPVTLSVTLGRNLDADRVSVYYTIDGTEPEGSRGRASIGQVCAMERVAVEWDLFGWGYVSLWRGEITGQSEGTKVTYKIGAWSTRGPDDEVFADNQVTESHAATRFAYGVDTVKTPEWVRDAAIYQILVDRFYPGDGKAFLKPRSPRGLYGGTLRGVVDKLGYLSDLGVNCIWLSPLFVSPSYHGYDVIDYMRVRPHLGTNQDLRDLVRLAHECGIKVLLDFVPNHISHRHPYFLHATSDRASRYHAWFTFRDWPDDYATFFTARNLPQINLENPEARQFMLDAARYWLETAGIDGYRLDYADGPSHNFWVDFRRTVKDAAPDCFTVGELVESADIVRSYEGRLDGALDFLFLDAARRFFAFDALDAPGFDAFLSRHEAFFSPDFVRPTFLDNHDMNRFMYLTGNDKTRTRIAAACQFALPQPPIVYYGTEVGMSQQRDKRDRTGHGDAEVRSPMIWGGRQDSDTLAYYNQLFHMRSTHAALRRGRRTPLYADSSGVLAFSLGGPGETVIVVLNNGESTRTVSIPMKAAAAPEGANLRGLLDKGHAQVRDGAVRLRLAPRSSRILAGNTTTKQ